MACLVVRGNVSIVLPRWQAQRVGGEYFSSLLKEGTTRLLPVQHLIQLLKDADRKLQGVHAHPRDLTIVGVRTEDAEALTLLVARKASRQRRLDEDLADETQAEREAAKAMVHRISPLVNLLQEKRLSTEQLCTALLQKLIRLVPEPPLFP